MEGVSGKYLILVNLSGNGRVRLLYPILKGDPALIADPNFDLPLRTAEPFGADHLVAIASDRRLEQVEAAVVAIDGQNLPRAVVEILRTAQSSNRGVRIGMAASFTAP